MTSDARWSEIHGQHDERALVDPGAHRELLDAFGGHLGVVRSTGDAWRHWRDCEQELSRHRAKVAAAAREADYLRAAVAELTKLDPQPGEETDLAEVRASMMRAEKTLPKSMTRRMCCRARPRRCRNWRACSEGCSAR